MIEGFVELDLEAVVPLTLRRPDGWAETVEAVIDTGFSGWVSLPSHLVESLGLEWERVGRAALANGEEIDVNIYAAEVEWHGVWRGGVVDEADTDPLIGMHLLRGSRLEVDVTEGGRVSIRSLADGTPHATP